MMGETEVNIFSFNEPDLTVQIFLYLNLEDLLAVELTCKDWRELGKRLFQMSSFNRTLHCTLLLQ